MSRHTIREWHFLTAATLSTYLIQTSTVCTCIYCICIYVEILSSNSRNNIKWMTKKQAAAAEHCTNTTSAPNKPPKFEFEMRVLCCQMTPGFSQDIRCHTWIRQYCNRFIFHCWTLQMLLCTRHTIRKSYCTTTDTAQKATIHQVTTSTNDFSL